MSDRVVSMLKDIRLGISSCASFRPDRPMDDNELAEHVRHLDATHERCACLELHFGSATIDHRIERETHGLSHKRLLSLPTMIQQGNELREIRQRERVSSRD